MKIVFERAQHPHLEPRTNEALIVISSVREVRRNVSQHCETWSLTMLTEATPYYVCLIRPAHETIARASPYFVPLKPDEAPLSQGHIGWHEGFAIIVSDTTPWLDRPLVVRERPKWKER